MCRAFYLVKPLLILILKLLESVLIPSVHFFTQEKMNQKIDRLKTLRNPTRLGFSNEFELAPKNYGASNSKFVVFFNPALVDTDSS